MPETEIQYQLHGIEMIEFHMQRKPVTEKIPSRFQFDIKANVRVHEERKMLLVVVEIAVREFEKKEHLVDMAAVTAFYVDNFSDVMKKGGDEDLYVVPEVFGLHMRNLAISTARGVLYSQLKGTYLNNAILPLIVDLKPTIIPE